MRVTTRVGCLLVGLVLAGTARGQDAPKPLPADVRAAWEKAGAQVGWMSSPAPRSYGVSFRPGTGKGKPGEVPAFRFLRWQAGVLAKVPAPEQAFGIVVSDTKMNYAGLSELGRFKHLRSLSIGGMTDKGLKALAGLQQLQSLFLNDTDVTDAGLKELAGLTQLRFLDLGGTEVTGAGLKALAGLKELRILILIKAKVTEAGLKAMGGLKTLQTLNLGGTEVMDAWLKGLVLHKELRTLDLTNTPITDAGLKELAGLKQLQSLSLEMTKVTDAGVRELQKALPSLKIQR